MKTIQLSLPDSVDMPGYEVKMFLAAKLYEAGKLSLGQAAKIAGISIRTFAEILDKFMMPYFNYSSSDLKTDFENARKHSR
ncbi:MAG: UPF0175 family protein [Bacteroidetes bacterium]|nr:UPF0175 family protein [Bacteroidota bacterium]